MSYKILATDIDGTITDEKGRIHLKAVEWIRRLEEKGVKVILVSGRPLPFLESLSLFVGTSGPIIAENGAVVKMNGRTKLFGNPELAKEALSVLKRKGIPVELDEDNKYRQVDISLRLNADPEKILTVIQDQKLPVSILVTNVMFHLVDRQVSKGGTLLRVLEDLSIKPSEVVVSGDSYNDLPLFEIGAFNLAVGNGAEALRSKANKVAKAFYGEGFSELIQEIFEKFNS